MTAAAALAAGSLGTAQAATPTAPSPSPETTQVTYRGHEFTVPADWDVVDLEKNPTTCVRFDRHALYLGTPGDTPDCAARQAGRTEAMHVAPAADTSAAEGDARVTRNSTSRMYEATADGISVTAAYGSDQRQIEDILRSAELPVGDASAQQRQDPPSVKAVPVDATSHQGEAFDACTAPSTDTMNAWKDASPFGAVGIYIGGVNRSCDQPQLTADWVQTQYGNGWKFFPLYVGLQVQESESCPGCALINDPVADGAAAARDMVDQAKALGFADGSVLYYDMEHYDRGGAHTTTALRFFDAWTDTLHELGYRSGVYGDTSSVMPDLVDAARGGEYAIPDVIDFARWDENPTTEDPAIPADLWADHQRMKQYRGGHDETHGGVTINIDSNVMDVGEGGVDPPDKKKTELAYTGAESLSNGSPAELSATLKDEDGKAVPERKVSFALGTGETEQTCEGTTNDKGSASCTIDPVKQKLNGDGTVPVAFAFAGDDAYEASEGTDEVKLEYVSGRAYGLKADVPLLGLPIGIKPTPDTGEVRTAEAETVKPPCAQSISTLVLSAEVLCAQVATTTGPSTATSTASLEEARLGLPGLPVLGVSGVTSTSTSSCSAQSGSVDLTLTVAGTPVKIGDTPNFEVDLGVAGTKLVVNEQVKQQVEGADKLTVNAVHLTAPGGIDVVLGSSASAAHNCAA